jgi:hypothetical protein
VAIDPGFCLLEVQRETHEGTKYARELEPPPTTSTATAEKGKLATNRREQQEIVTLSLPLMLNCLMLINTLLVERTLERENL